MRDAHLANLAYGALANLQQADAACAPPARVRVRYARVPSPRVSALPALFGGGNSPSAGTPTGARAIPRYVQQMQPWSHGDASRRAAADLAAALAEPSLDAPAALALLASCDAVPALLALLRTDPGGERPAAVSGARLAHLRPPVQPDLDARDAALLALAHVARLGGSDLLFAELAELVGAAGGALVATERRTRLIGVALWQQLTVRGPLTP